MRSDDNDTVARENVTQEAAAATSEQEVLEFVIEDSVSSTSEAAADACLRMCGLCR